MPEPAAKRIVVVGSANMDMVGRTFRLPRPGETVIGGEFLMHPGGKGANQAVAAARLGAETYFIGCLGRDAFGESLARSLSDSGVNLTRMRIAESAATGIALIGVAESTGENSIIVLPGANSELTPADIDASADLIKSADALVCSLEAPLAAVGHALDIAAGSGVPTVLNPAPAAVLPQGALAHVSVLTPNEHEVRILAQVPPSTAADDAARALVALGARSVVVTLGSQGALIVDRADGTASQIPAAKVESVVDTTAAGDCFTAALAVALAEGRTLAAAAAFACAAASFSVTRPGAQSSLPWRAELDTPD